MMLDNIGIIDRTKYLGGSDVGAILGLSKWRTPVDVYLDKIEPRKGTISPKQRKLFDRGSRMEPYIRALLVEDEGIEIVAFNNRYRHPEYSFLAAEIDFETADGKNGEIKTVSPYAAKEWGEPGEDEIPLHYVAQVHHGLMVTGREEAVVAALIGSDDLRIYNVRRDDDLIAMILEKEIEFWQRIQDRNPPEPVNVDDIKKLYGAAKDSAIEATDEILELSYRLASLNDEIKALDKEQSDIKFKIQAFMGNNSVLLSGTKDICTWKEQVSKRFNQEAFKSEYPELFERFKTPSKSRVFRVK